MGHRCACVDFVAAESRYHSNCLLRFNQNKASEKINEPKSGRKPSQKLMDCFSKGDVCVPIIISGDVCVPIIILGDVCVPIIISGDVCVPIIILGDVCVPIIISGDVCVPIIILGDVCVPIIILRDVCVPIIILRHVCVPIIILRDDTIFRTCRWKFPAIFGFVKKLISI